MKDILEAYINIQKQYLTDLCKRQCGRGRGGVDVPIYGEDEGTAYIGTNWYIIGIPKSLCILRKEGLATAFPTVFRIHDNIGGIMAKADTSERLEDTGLERKFEKDAVSIFRATNGVEYWVNNKFTKMFADFEKMGWNLRYYSSGKPNAPIIVKMYGFDTPFALVLPRRNTEKGV